MGQQQPFISIIVPTYNRPAQLAACLESLARLDYPRDRFEVIVVDDGGQMPLEAVVAPFLGRLDLALVTRRHVGSAAARNTGAARTKGEFLAFTDDDCTTSPNWLQTLAARFATAPDHAIGGRTVNALSDNPYSTASQLLHDVVYDYFNAEPGQARFLASNNLAVPRDGYRGIGGFDETFTRSEDRDFCDRWLQHGYRMTYAPEVLVYHAHPLIFRTFWRQHFNYGRGASRFHRVDAGRFVERFRPDAGFYFAVFHRPFSEGGIRRASSLAALLLMCHVAKAAGFFWEGLHHGVQRMIRR